MNQNQRDAVLLSVRDTVDLVKSDVETIKLTLQSIDMGGSGSDVEIGLLAFIAGAVVAVVFVVGLKLG
ncbi:MAG: hypothetical protein LBH00_10575 [Planctomycetaceae bacterium]|jgi:hypothetical protein|nr:hypothetical protein [Planctomycetaceae bacterium]